MWVFSMCVSQDMIQSLVKTRLGYVCVYVGVYLPQLLPLAARVFLNMRGHQVDQDNTGPGSRITSGEHPTGEGSHHLGKKTGKSFFGLATLLVGNNCSSTLPSVKLFY